MQPCWAYFNRYLIATVAKPNPTGSAAHVLGSEVKRKLLTPDLARIGRPAGPVQADAVAPERAMGTQEELKNDLVGSSGGGSKNSPNSPDRANTIGCCARESSE
jgi:hypothetical protein